ncbi:taste receptor type 2 member 39-like [Dendropsophus ebraccatus]|uniref:taste receptor type 2 member 39-like n=1 Tax=Dendropsophus ebraccatus TaxID=150705 RepID=UPI0038319219
MDPNEVIFHLCVVVLAVETSVGVLSSVYVIVIILLDFHKKNNMRTGNKIRMALGLSNVCFSVIMFTSVFSHFFWPVTSGTTSSNCILYSFTMYCISTCSWLSASLSFFYFIKIVNMKIRCFVWVKANISPIVSWLLLVTQVVSFGSFFAVFFLIVPRPTVSNSTISSNSAMTVGDLRRQFVYIIIVVTFMPLLTVLFTTITTAVVLKQHRLKMVQNLGPNIQLETYNSAVFRMLRLLFFFTMFYTVMLIFYFPVFVEMTPGFWVSLIIMSTFTSVQSILIAFGNPNLKRAWKEVTKCIRSCKP